MTEILLPFGLHASGRMIDIAHANRGLECDCVCAACSGRLVAVKGSILQHHFRHHAEGVACVAARETALHRIAKQVICERLELTLPTDLGPMRSAISEYAHGDIRPDVWAQYDSEPVGVEIYVAHRVPPEKVRKLVEIGLTSIEVDLSYYRDQDMSEEQVANAVIYMAGRRWICEPLAVRKARAAKLEQLREAERQAAEWHAIMEAARKKLADERLEELLARREEWQRVEAERQAERRKVEAEQQAAHAEEAAREAKARREEQEVALAREEQRRATLAAWEASKRPPNLQDLVAAYNGYSKITPEAWARFDADMARWKADLRDGRWHEKP